MIVTNSPQFLRCAKISSTILRLSSSWWSDVKLAPPDPIFGKIDAFARDRNPRKVNLGIGIYRDDDGKPYILPSIAKAEQRVVEKKLNKEYLPHTGCPNFTKLATELAFGEDNPILKNGRYATFQSISGTGALRLTGMFLKNFFPGHKEIYLPDPSWGNHENIFRNSGLKINSYKYFAPGCFTFNEEVVYDSINKIPEKSLLLFHACGHNPTGIDPSPEQWKELSKLVKRRKLLPVFDLVYMGFASGDIDRDAFGIRQFATDEHEFIVTQSFAKNMGNLISVYFLLLSIEIIFFEGLYGERVGAVTFITKTPDHTSQILSQVEGFVKGLYWSPPNHGIRIATEILSDKELCAEWRADVKKMTERLTTARHSLRQQLEKWGSSRDWKHITDHVGWFTYSGLNSLECECLTNKYSVHITKDGRMALTGVNPGNVEYLAFAIREVTN
ncbi:aspartate aminotransferase, mitochondrial-like isoform X1 [Phlebotomus papatasi]|uniref:aspartate aminotransferase, mitochondrial-like isoform X1 n=1 Tax=Phlebotomus papatasi TaxID=29031 RepID=UPI0024843CB1|nr:aspartate aminotransferase, mitochondrial-like isoform X1 [Phlebotomus papatasi]